MSAQLPPGRGRQQQDISGGRRSEAEATRHTPDRQRPGLGMTDEEKAVRRAQAEQAIRDHALAVQAVRVLEGVARGPMVRSPLTMARALRELADHFEAVA